jgi:predicted nucleotide-binding protein (sugar kinase/HSP70/actin superfamily)
MGYYYLYPFYKTFLEDLGTEVVVSPPTTKSTLDRMEACPTDEPCIAVKLFFAHSERLSSMDVDFIFNPILVSLEKDNFCCPKFLGISDMVRNGLRLDESALLSPRFDFRLDTEERRQPFFTVAAQLGVADRDRVEQAIDHALRVQISIEELMSEKKLTVPAAYRILDAGALPKDAGTQPSEDAPCIGVVGHPYVLYDMLGQQVMDQTKGFGRIITAEMVNRKDSKEALSDIFESERMWSFEGRILGSALYLLKNRKVDKLILVGSFECGPESIIESYVEDEAARQGIPFLLLTIDEQTGQAGLETRIEAFMDTASGRGTAKDPGVDMPEKRISPVGADELVVGFPSMGYLDIAVRALLEECGTRCIRTAGTNKHAIELGAELSPEFVCFPLTATLGQMRALLEAGANTIFMVNGKGRCRLGWYAQVQEKLLNRAGYRFDMVTLDSPFPIKTNWSAFRDTLKHLTNDAPWKRIVQSIYFGYRKMSAIDCADAACREIRAIERERGSIDKLFDRFVRRVDRASDMKSLKREMRDFKEAVRSIEVEETNPIRVRIVGEIWVVLERFVNQEMEKMLGGREDVRVVVDSNLSATNWFRRNVLGDPFLIAREKKVVHAASRFLREEVGGHGLESVGETVLAPQEGCDGVVHIFPFTCMPEIVAQNILVRVSDELDIPVLTFIVSEQTGEAGLQTRVEAFLDVLEDRRRHGKSAESKRDIEWHTSSA